MNNSRLSDIIRYQFVTFFQNKPFPSEDDLIDRLDNNFQWEEFKQNTLGDYLIHLGRMTSEEKSNVTIDLTGS